MNADLRDLISKANKLPLTARMRQEALALEQAWKTGVRWAHIQRPYTALDVIRLRGSNGFQVVPELSNRAADLLFSWFQSKDVKRIAGYGAINGSIAADQVRAYWKWIEKDLKKKGYPDLTALQDSLPLERPGKKVLNTLWDVLDEAGIEVRPMIYGSGWNNAFTGNDNKRTFPDLSLYSMSSMISWVKDVWNALRQQDRNDRQEMKNEIEWFVPNMVDAETGHGGVLKTFQLVYEMIEAGAAIIHLEDQGIQKKCGHMSGMLVASAVNQDQKLVAAMLARDILGARTILVSRTDAMRGKFIDSDIDERDAPFLKRHPVKPGADYKGKTVRQRGNRLGTDSIPELRDENGAILMADGTLRTDEGYFLYSGGLEAAVAHQRAFADHSDAFWVETGTPESKEIRSFTERFYETHPWKRGRGVYNLSGNFDFTKYSDADLMQLQQVLIDTGMKVQFNTIQGVPIMREGTLWFSPQFFENGPLAMKRSQERVKQSADAAGVQLRNQRDAGANWYDDAAGVIGTKVSQSNIAGESTEHQFDPAA